MSWNLRIDEASNSYLPIWLKGETTYDDLGRTWFAMSGICRSDGTSVLGNHVKPNLADTGARRPLSFESRSSRTTTSYKVLVTFWNKGLWWIPPITSAKLILYYYHMSQYFWLKIFVYPFSWTPTSKSWLESSHFARTQRSHVLILLKKLTPFS